jgi:hypothetical protein
MIARPAAALAGLLLVAGCTSGGDGSPQQPTETTPSPSTAVQPTPSQPVPAVGECRAYGLKAAVAPVSRVEPRSCRRQHTAETFFVGRLDLVRGGHRLAVDSPAVQAQPAQRCTEGLSRHLRATPRELRLTMAQALWFTPSVDDATAGADWFRCDVVVVAAPDRLLPLPRRTAGMPLERIAMCATAEPGTSGFTRVVCSRRHSWRAVATVDLPGAKVPAPAVAADRMESACRDAARARASDPLDFEWSQESPTRQQWEAGRRWGICWAPA